MKKLLLICASTLAITAGNTVNANEGFTASLLGGANWTTTRGHHHGSSDSSDHRFNGKFKNGYVIGGALGYQWCEGMRLEGEIAYRKNDLRDRNHHHSSSGSSSSHDHYHGHLSTWSYMVNGIYEMSLDCYYLKPYAGVGIGYADQKLHVARHGGHNRHKSHYKGFAYQLIGGLAYSVCENVDVNLEYRFFRAKNNGNNNALVVGTKYSF